MMALWQSHLPAPDCHNDAVVREWPKGRLEDPRKAEIGHLDSSRILRPDVIPSDQNIGGLHGAMVRGLGHPRFHVGWDIRLTWGRIKLHTRT